MSFDVFDRIGEVADHKATYLETAELVAYLLNTGAARHGFLGNEVARCIDEGWVGLDPDGLDWIVNPEIDWELLEDEREWT